MALTMKWTYAGLAGVVAAVGIGYLMLVHLSLSPACELTRLESQPSPDGRFVSSAFLKDCGATTDYVTGVTLRPAGAAFVDENPDVVLILNGIVPVSQTWVADEEIHLRLPSAAPVFRQVENWNGVKIVVEQ